MAVKIGVRFLGPVWMFKCVLRFVLFVTYRKICLQFYVSQIVSYEVNFSNHATKIRCRKSKVFCTHGTEAQRSSNPTFQTGELKFCS